MSAPAPTHSTLSQWDCIRPNLGEWYGTFTQFSPTGERVKATPSVLTLVEDRPDENMQLTLVRTPSDAPPQTNRIAFSAPGPAPYVVFFPSGAFSQGPLQRQGWRDFGAELALNAETQRLRSVQMYDSDLSGNGVLRYVTLITEHRDLDNAQAQAPSPTLADLSGEWTGEARFQSADTSRPLLHGQSRYQLIDSQSQGWQCHSEIVTSAGEMLLQDSQSDLVSATDQQLSNGQVQLLLLPGGAVCSLPYRLLANQPFTLELAWLLAPERRQRLIRQYDASGSWVGLFWITESRSAG